MPGTREKLILTFVFLLAVNTTPPTDVGRLLVWLALLVIAGAIARVQAWTVVRRTAGALVFALPLIAAMMFRRDAAAASGTLLRVVLSAGAVVLLASGTRPDRLIHAARSLGCPRGLALVLQFLLRYSHVLAGQAGRIRHAWGARAGQRLHGAAARSAVAGGLASLWLSASERSERIHRAMLARGYDGEVRLLDAEPLHARNVLATSAAILVIAVIRVWPWIP